jgi:MFS family permease
MAAVLQTVVNFGIMLASLAVFLLVDLPPRTVFVVGVLPAFLVLWVRRAVPESDEWYQARSHKRHDAPRFSDLFRGKVRRVTVLTLCVCALSLTAHWAFMFWCLQHLGNLPDLSELTEGRRSQIVSQTLTVLMISSIAGNFLAAVFAHRLGYRRAIALLCLVYFGAMLGAYGVPRDDEEMWPWLVVIGICLGVFALFTMYLPPLFPTLLRTTGAGFCYNFGRVAAALGTVFFGLFANVGDYRLALCYAAFLFLPAAALACVLPELPKLGFAESVD